MAEQIRLPPSGGGLLRYTEETPSKFMIGPKAVVAMILAVILFEAALHVFF